MQSAINDGRLIFTEGTKMKIYTDPFPVNVINFENKNVVVDDSAVPRMVKPKGPEVGMWKVNEGKKPITKASPTVKHLLDKYTSRKASNVFNRLGGTKRPLVVRGTDKEIRMLNSHIF